MSAAPFIVKWRKALLNSGLPPAVRHVGHVMAEHADTATGENCYPSARRLADETGYTRRYVTDHRQALVAAGFAVEVSKGGSAKGGKRLNSVFGLTIPTLTGEPHGTSQPSPTGEPHDTRLVNHTTLTSCCAHGPC